MRMWLTFIACVMMGLVAGQDRSDCDATSGAASGTAFLQLGHKLPKAPVDENYCKLVSSRGIMFSCDVRPNNGVSDTQELMLVSMTSTSLQSLGMQHYAADIAAHGDGVIVYVVTTALPAFVDQVLPGIKKRVKLVTGDSDQGPIHVLGQHNFEALVNSKKLIHWFGQNAVDNETANPKFTQIPIGLDYHTLKTQAKVWGQQASPAAQEEELLAKRSHAPQFTNRSAKAFWSGSMSSELRRAAVEQLPVSFVDQTEFINRAEVWENMATHQFVISPPGNGIDCHRTWEAIALGSIPIVSKRLSSLYADNGFPVVTVGDNEWAELGSKHGQKRLKEAAAKAPKVMPPAMYLEYWVQKFRKA